MLDQVDDLLRAGIWLGPSVLGALCYRLVANVASSNEDLAGAVMLATAAILLTAASVRHNRDSNTDKHALIVPAVFAAMFVVSWSMR
jgi:hypothetical protein